MQLYSHTARAFKQKKKENEKCLALIELCIAVLSRGHGFFL